MVGRRSTGDVGMLRRPCSPPPFFERQTVAVAETLFFWTVTASWLVVVVAMAIGVRRLPALPSIASPPQDSVVSVVIPARNEALSIETTVRRVLAQREVDLEVILVDDRSDDGTGAILDRLADADERIRVLHIEDLPEGWLGKCNALHVGARQARGEWILFLDADTWMTPLVIGRAVQAARRDGADHVCLMPRQRDATMLGKACILMLLAGVPDVMNKANRDRAGVGFGAFNLVRADALRDIGGYATLRLEVVDDLQLGRVLYRAGKRTRGYFAGRDVEMDLARTPAGLVKAVQKNAFAILRYSVPIAALIGLILTAMLAGAVAGPVVGGPGPVAAGMSYLALAIPGTMLARRYGWPVLAGMLAPVDLQVVLFAGCNSVLTTLVRGGVRWRDDFHRLAELRRAMVR